MKTGELINLRLVNQQITGTSFRTPAELVDWLGAMQAQEYAMAKWAIGLRLRHLRDDDVEKAFNEGSILRTHLLRPTWHFVTPENIRWMLQLTAPRVHAFNASYYKKSELDNLLLGRSAEVLVKALRDGTQLTRNHLKAALEKAKIVTDGLRFTLILMYAELKGIICSGARQGKQFTYALLDERVPATENINRHEALAKLVMLYFKSRGPATLHDFVWWSGLTMKDARDGTAMVADQLDSAGILGNTYYFSQGMALSVQKKVHLTFLLPDYDEYGISYKDRSAIFPDKKTGPGSRNPVFNHLIIMNGIAGGTWKRTEKNNSFLVEVSPFTPLNATNQLRITKAVKQYTSFFTSIRGET